MYTIVCTMPDIRYVVGVVHVRIRQDLSGGSRLVAVDVAEVRGTINHEGGVYGNCRGWQGSNLDEGPHRRVVDSTRWTPTLLGQSKSNPPFVKNVTYHSRTTHIQRRYHWLQEKVEEEDFALTKVHMEENRLDMLTKVLSEEKLDECRRRVGLMKHPMPEWRGSFLGKWAPPDEKRMSQISLTQRRKLDGKSTNHIGWIQSWTRCGRYPTGSEVN